MKTKIVALLGWYGVAAILGAYVLVSFDIVTVHGYAYQLLNFTGALGIVIETTSKKDKQPAVLNIVWLLVALVAIIKLMIS